jgi:hypothetical protein
MAITKAVRLSDEEMENIERFLAQNPFFDFSTLARLAIQSFMEAPTVQIRPLESGKPRRRPTTEEGRTRHG